MIKVANTSVRSEWPHVVDLGKPAGAEQTRFLRPAPAEPLSFFEGHRHGSKTYTNGADRDALVAPKFRQTIFTLLGGVRELNFASLGWTDAQAVELAVVLPLCGQLRTLQLQHNDIGDRGISALAVAFCTKSLQVVTLPNLSSILLGFNYSYGARGQQALAKALRNPHTLPSLNFLEVSRFQFSRLRTVCDTRNVELKTGSKRHQPPTVKRYSSGDQESAESTSEYYNHAEEGDSQTWALVLSSEESPQANACGKGVTKQLGKADASISLQQV